MPHLQALLPAQEEGTGSVGEDDDSRPLERLSGARRAVPVRLAVQDEAGLHRMPDWSTNLSVRVQARVGSNLNALKILKHPASDRLHAMQRASVSDIKLLENS